MMMQSKLFLIATFFNLASAFLPPFSRGAAAPSTVVSTATKSTTFLQMAGDDNNQEFLRWARASRTASSDDNVVELSRPLGLVLNQDDRGNVYVETVAPKGNAARTGKVSLLR